MPKTSWYGKNAKFECRNKARVRAQYYSIPTHQRFYEGKHIAIASRDCGDIKYLLAHGVAPANIIVCDRDPIAQIACKRDYPGLTWAPSPKHRDIVDTVQWAVDTFGAQAIATVNVDLCESLATTLPVLQAVFETGLALSTVVALTYARGRDKGETATSRLATLDRECEGRTDHWDYVSYRGTEVFYPMGVAVYA